MRYRVKALRPGSGVTTLTIEALDEGEVASRLQREGAQVLSIVAEHGNWLNSRRTRFPLLLFTQELIALLDAGLTLTEALETLAEKESRPESHLLCAASHGRLAPLLSAIFLCFNLSDYSLVSGGPALLLDDSAQYRRIGWFIALTSVRRH